jgi:hypothetical protein
VCDVCECVCAWVRGCVSVRMSVCVNVICECEYEFVSE